MRSLGVSPCSSSSGASPRQLPGASPLEVPVSSLHGFFLGLFFGDPFGKVLQELVLSLKVKLMWLFSKEMVLPVCSSALEMLAEPSCAASHLLPRGRAVPPWPTSALDGQSVPKVLGTSLGLTETPVLSTLVLPKVPQSFWGPCGRTPSFSVSYSHTRPVSVPEVASRGPSTARGCLERRTLAGWVGNMVPGLKIVPYHLHFPPSCSRRAGSAGRG